MTMVSPGLLEHAAYHVALSIEGQQQQTAIEARQRAFPDLRRQGRAKLGNVCAALRPAPRLAVLVAPSIWLGVSGLDHVPVYVLAIEIDAANPSTEFASAIGTVAALDGFQDDFLALDH